MRFQSHVMFVDLNFKFGSPKVLAGDEYKGYIIF